MELSNVENELKPPRRHHGINAIVITLMISLSSIGAISIRNNVCNVEVTSFNPNCIGINFYLASQVIFAESAIKNAFQYLFPKKES